MKITISVGGRFHAFYLAKYLQDHKHLHQLITSYPRFEVKKYGINTSKVKSIVVKEIIERSYRKIFQSDTASPITADIFDYIASKRINFSSNIYIIWSGFALKTIKMIRKHNPDAIIILERGSVHIAVQDELLRSTNNGKSPVQKRVIDKELQEYDLVDYISLPSKFAANSFLAKGIDNSKLFINNLGVNLKDFNNLDTYKKTKLEFTVGYVGIISAQKNVMGLINAVKKLYEKGINIRLILVGYIDKATFPVDLTANSLPFLYYHSSVPQKRLSEYYSQMDLFVLNSIQDGFGMVLLQAMSMGLPVIATTNTGGLDVIQEGENGFIIPINNEEYLREKIKYFYDNREECKRMGLNARKTVEGGYSWEDYGTRALKFYKSIYNGK